MNTLCEHNNFIYFFKTENVCSKLDLKLRKKLRKSFGKQRTFCHTKIFIDNRKETEYAGFITHLHLLLHIVTLDTEVLFVP